MAQSKEDRLKYLRDLRAQRRKDDVEGLRAEILRANLKRWHGITIEEYEDLVTQAQGCCEICGDHFSKFPKHRGTIGRLHIDHDHKTGLIRGVLCRRCNLLLGYALDSPTILRKAIVYLFRSNLG